MLQHGVRRLAGNLHVAAGLKQVHLVDDVQQQVRDFVGAIAAIGEESGQIEVGEVRVGAALRRRHAHLGRGRVVVELHEEALQQFFGSLAGERAIGETLLVEGPQMLIQMSWAEGVPAVQFGDHREVAEPIHLQSFMEIARGVGGHPAADFGDLPEFLLARGVACLGGLCLSQLGVPLGEADDRIASDGHGP